MALVGVRIHITGIVQGVGFRPFVYGLARRYQLNGWVRNTSAGVDIEVDGERIVLEQFIDSLKNEIPPLARLDRFEVDWIGASAFASFEIVHSEGREGDFIPISPDVSLCPDCWRELYSPGDRRYRYPFINCTNCGPRFTIIKDIPYDRPKTTMAPFAMCPDCAREYQDPLDRRFHAQPVACSLCGPKVWLETAGETQAEKEDALQHARELLADGRILALKGLGGFHLACDATNAEAVAELRCRKLRVDKPFALMMPDIDAVGRYCLISEAERELLRSRQRPIVLLERKSDSAIVAQVAPGQSALGVMLPYTPLHYLLLEKADDFPDALVMTSGNLSEEPIAYTNDDARQRLSSLADAFLLNNRDIHMRCDDSVARVVSGKIYPLRRSRGYAPDAVQLPFSVPPILAAGSELKNTFCLTREKYAFLSHHIGDLENYETLRSFEQGIEHFERLFRLKPEAIACDAHPNYLATRYAHKRAEHDELPLFSVQHHHAHIAACMADNGLTGEHAVIGVAFDGTGYGDDGAVWGGEFLVADYRGYQRAAHLEYFPLPGGDVAVRQPARTALALLWALGIDWDERLAPAKEFCGDDRNLLRTQLERRINAPLTSSMGRFFDAAAALAGVRQKVNYEAQAAIEFEALADPHESGAYLFGGNGPEIRVRNGVEMLIADVLAGIPIPIVSARFHNGLANLVFEKCRQLRIANMGNGKELNEVVLSGGVWQNITILRRTVSLLEEHGFTVYTHRQVPTNDGGISLGQAAIAAKLLGG